MRVRHDFVTQNEFTFVREDLDKTEAGESKRAEIDAVFEAFKNEIRKVCKDKYGQEVRFDSACGEMARSFASQVSQAFGSGEITVYVSSKRLDILRYVKSPLSGYPVDVIYDYKSVECNNRDQLLATIRDAFSLCARGLRELCLQGSSWKLPEAQGLTMEPVKHQPQ